MGSAPQIYAASIGIQDSIFLMLLALVVFGPRRLPEIGRQIGKLMYEFRKVSNDFKFQMEEELRAHEEAERQRKLQAALPPPAPTMPALAAAPAPGMEDPAYKAAEATEAAAKSSAEVSTETLPTTAEAQPEASGGLRVQPPSTGEQVAAARPFRTGAAAESPAPEDVAGTGGELKHEAQAEVSAETESNHG